MSLIDRKPEYLGRLLHSFTQPGPLGEEPVFSFTEFSQVYDPKAIIERLDRYGDHAFSNPAERRVAELFRQQYANNNPEQHHPEEQET